MLQQPYLPERFSITRVITICTNVAYLTFLTKKMFEDVLSALEINCYSLKMPCAENSKAARSNASGSNKNEVRGGCTAWARRPRTRDFC